MNPISFFTTFLLAITITISGCVHSSSSPTPEQNPSLSPQSLILDPQTNSMVEYYFEVPEGTGPFPTIILIHGHQEDAKLGARSLVDAKALTKWKSLGVLAVAVSQPGYGKSDGPADYCGPRSQGAVEVVIDHLIRQKIADKNRIVLMGISRGAVVAAMVATHKQFIKGLVLVGGIYDFANAVPKLPPEIQKNVEMECGLTNMCYYDRSALQHVDQIKSSTLLVHGEKDDRSPVLGALQLQKALKKRKVAAEIKVFKDQGHMIPPAERNKVIDPFVRKILGLTYKSR